FWFSFESGPVFEVELYELFCTLDFIESALLPTHVVSLMVIRAPVGWWSAYCLWVVYPTMALSSGMTPASVSESNTARVNLSPSGLVMCTVGADGFSWPTYRPVR